MNHNYEKSGSSKLNMSKGIIILLSIILALALFFIVVMVIDGNRFRVVKYELVSSKIKKEHAFVVLSDLHNKEYGKNNEKLLKRIDKLNPEAILIAGDILTAKPQKSYAVALELLQKLAVKYPIYYGMGNHETRLFLYPEVYEDMGKRYEHDLIACNIRLMRNEAVECEDSIRIHGLDMKRDYYKRFKKYPMDESYLKDTLGEISSDKYEILLAHNPDYFEEYVAWGADLVLSGHVHGGMMRLPILGGVVSPAFRLFPKYDGGMFEIGKSKMILSRGLGMHTIPIRIFNPGELILLKIGPKSE